MISCMKYAKDMCLLNLRLLGGCEFQFKISQMISLASDPQSILFLKGNRISLPLLKNQIDRRLLKITCLVNKMDRKRRKSHQNKLNTKKEHKYTQSDASFIGNSLVGSDDGVVLAAINQNEMNNRGVRIGSNIKGCWNADDSSKAQRIKGSQLKRWSIQRDEPQLKEIRQSQQPSACDHPLIQSNGFTFREIQQTHEGSTDRKQLQQSQDDKIFQSLDFGLQISNVEMCNSITSESEIKPYRTAFATRDPRSDLQTVSAFTDLSGSELGKEVTRRTRKIRMAGKEVVLPQPQKRIIVREQCKERMQQEVEILFSRKRKEVWDYKSRINVIKKIQEKYGEQYST